MSALMLQQTAVPLWVASYDELGQSLSTLLSYAQELHFVLP